MDGIERSKVARTNFARSVEDPIVETKELDAFEDRSREPLRFL